MPTSSSWRLLPGERILWSGTPVQGIVFTGRDLYLVPFSLLWCGFAIFWTFSAGGIGAPDFFLLWGAMFVAIGLFFVFGRFAVDMWLRRHTAYAVTDRRILIAREGWKANSTSLDLALLPNLQLVDQRSTRGTIRFGPTDSFSFFHNRSMSCWIAALDPTPQFLAIDGASAVFDRIVREADRRRRSG